MVLKRPFRGQGMVEFALVGPILFVMLFGVMEGAWLLFHNHQVSNAAREGARYAVVHGEMSEDLATSESVREYVLERVQLANGESLEVALVQIDGNMEPESRIRVDVGYTHQTMVGFIFASASIDLDASSTMRVHF